MPTQPISITIALSNSSQEFRVLNIYRSAGEDPHLVVVAKYSQGPESARGVPCDKLVSTPVIEVPYEGKPLDVKYYIIGFPRVHLKHYWPNVTFTPVYDQDDIPREERAVCLYANEYTEQKEALKNLAFEAIYRVAVNYLYDHYFYEQGFVSTTFKPSPDVDEYERLLHQLIDEKAREEIYTKPRDALSQGENLIIDALDAARQYVKQEQTVGNISQAEMNQLLDQMGITQAVESQASHVNYAALATMGMFAIGATKVLYDMGSQFTLRR